MGGAGHDAGGVRAAWVVGELAGTATGYALHLLKIVEHCFRLCVCLVCCLEACFC